MTIQERRSYFRINEHLGLAWRVLADEDLTTEGASGGPDVFSLLSDYDASIERLLGELAGREPKLIELFTCLNKKVNCIINQLELESRLVEQIAHHLYEVNLSACGLAMLVDEPVAAGTLVELDLLLLPESRRLVTRARVVGCEPRDSRHYLRLQFQDLNNQTQEQLIQHIVRRQGDMLRDSRLRQEAEPAPGES